MCRIVASRGREVPSERLVRKLVEMASGDSAGKVHPDGWGFAVLGKELYVYRSSLPIWEDLVPIPKGRIFIGHVREGRLKGIEHAHPHVCFGVVAVHNGGALVPKRLLVSEGIRTHMRTSSEALTCLMGILMNKLGIEKGLMAFVRLVKPTKAVNIAAIYKGKLIVINYHNGDKYYTLWSNEELSEFSSEPLKGFQPLSVDGRPVVIVDGKVIQK